MNEWLHDYACCCFIYFQFCFLLHCIFNHMYPIKLDRKKRKTAAAKKQNQAWGSHSKTDDKVHNCYLTQYLCADNNNYSLLYMHFAYSLSSCMHMQYALALPSAKYKIIFLHICKAMMLIMVKVSQQLCMKFLIFCQWW